jgi:hypothetical protein
MVAITPIASGKRDSSRVRKKGETVAGAVALAKASPVANLRSITCLNPGAIVAGASRTLAPGAAISLAIGRFGSNAGVPVANLFAIAANGLTA